MHRAAVPPVTDRARAAQPGMTIAPCAGSGFRTPIASTRIAHEVRMNIFGKILGKIFGKKAPATPASPAPTPSATTPAAAPAAPVAPAPVVDVEAVLEEMASENSQRLNWRTSIVDLMKLLGMESSLAERRELADELGFTGDKSDTATMNIWLHKQVLRKLAENGGKVPADLLD
jgi:hypothetical protein